MQRVVNSHRYLANLWWHTVWQEVHILVVLQQFCMCAGLSMWNCAPISFVQSGCLAHLVQVITLDRSLCMITMRQLHASVTVRFFRNLQLQALCWLANRLDKAWLCASVSTYAIYVYVRMYKHMYIHMCAWMFSCHFIFCSQIGAYFGYSIAAVDFNGDMWVSDAVLLSAASSLCLWPRINLW